MTSWTLDVALVCCNYVGYYHLSWQKCGARLLHEYIPRLLQFEVVDIFSHNKKEFNIITAECNNGYPNSFVP